MTTEDCANYLETSKSQWQQKLLGSIRRFMKSEAYQDVLFENLKKTVKGQGKIFKEAIQQIENSVAELNEANHDEKELLQNLLKNPDQIEALMSSMLGRILQQTEIPAEAGEDIESAVEKTDQRIRNCDWSLERDDDTIFSQSPTALYYWSPIADELKERDEIIVRNSVRFRWIEIRRSARRQLDIELIFQNLSH